MACVVDIRHVSKYFAKVAANKDVSLTVDAGQVVALLGENGAGKSTIMKILSGLYAKDEGDINKALEAFQKCHDAYYEYKKAIADMKSYMRTIGYTDETKIVIFRN